MVKSSENVHVTGRLFGDRRASTTNLYVHPDDAKLSEAAEKVALVIQGNFHPLSQAVATREP